jgi:hypothetical protein
MEIDPKHRKWLLPVVSVLSVVAVIISVRMAFTIRASTAPDRVHSASAILAFWALVPPVFFWLEWTLFSKKSDEKERDRIKHFHELSRNIWIALVVVLATIMKIKWPLSD